MRFVTILTAALQFLEIARKAAKNGPAGEPAKSGQKKSGELLPPISLKM